MTARRNRLALSAAIVASLMLGCTPEPAAPTPQAATKNAVAAAGTRSAIAKSRDLAIHYDIYGDLAAGKTPLLVLHGAYMSADSMAAFVERFARSRPVIVVDQRGHGRTGDAKGPITYEALADDAAAVLDAAGVKQADVFGYSMGGGAAIQLAIRHPGKVAKLVSASASTRLNAVYPEVLAGIAQITPAALENTPFKREYDRLAPRPRDFPILVDKLKVLDATPFDWDAAMRRLKHKTMIVMGDHDVVTPEHAAEMFRMRGGGERSIVAQGSLNKPPPARLLILPATSHLGVIGEAEVIVALVTPFLDDVMPRMPPGF